MKDRLSRLESEVEKLSRALERVDDRLRSLEDRLGAPPGVSPSPSAGSETVPSVLAPSDSEIARGITLIGRTLLVLGGGYLIRALTESGSVAPFAGVALGLAYALVWLMMADLAGAKGNATSAAFHGGGAILVAFPLLWETTARFELLSPVVGASCLALMSAVAVAVAWRRRLRSFAWVTVVGATVTSVALLFATRELVPFSLLLVLIGVATLWLAYHGDWPAVHWVVAGTADVAVALLTIGLFVERVDVPASSALAVQLTLFAAFFGSFSFRILKQGHEPGLFEVLQAGAVTVIGYGGAMWTASRLAAGAVGACGVVAGIGVYGLCVASRSLGPRSSALLIGVAFVMLLFGAGAIFEDPTLFLALAGVALSWFGARFERPLFRLHGAAFILASAFTSGLLRHAAYAFLAPAEYAWPPVTAGLWIAFVAATVAYAMAWEDDREPWFVRWRVARILDLVVIVWALGSLVLVAGARSIAGPPGETADAAVLATIRTAVLGASAIALGGLGRVPGFREARWLVYPLLVAGGVKLAIEDFPQGRAVTLFVALALYGGALILAPRTARSST